MKKLLFLTLTFLTVSTTSVRAQVTIPTALAAWTLATTGLATGILATKACMNTVEMIAGIVKHTTQSQDNKNVAKGLVTVGGVITISSGAISYFALTNAYKLLQ